MTAIQIIEKILSEEKNARYVAILEKGKLYSKVRDEIENASAPDSDKYEELLVNPTLLKLTDQRGNIDCGGLKYVLVRYGHFFQWVRPLRDGHISVCISQDVQPLQVIEHINAVIASAAIS